jgi:hypothetical protein
MKIEHAMALIGGALEDEVFSKRADATCLISALLDVLTDDDNRLSTGAQTALLYVMTQLHLAGEGGHLEPGASLTGMRDECADAFVRAMESAR